MSSLDPSDPASSPSATALVGAASRSTVYGLFSAAARRHPQRIAIEHAEESEAPYSVSYAHLEKRVSALAVALDNFGVRQGDRIAILSENRGEFLELILAAAKIGACVACQNWRLSPRELNHCLSLVSPKLVFVSTRFAATLATLDESTPVIELGSAYENYLTGAQGSIGAAHAPPSMDPETPLLILYTSGTTGLPKGAVLSHRAEIVRNLVVRAEFGVSDLDTFVAWSPLYHMGAAECSLGTLMTGGKVIVVQGFNAPVLATLVEREELGWLLLMPGMVGRFADELETRDIQPRGVKLCGVMADLVPPAEIARITRRLDAPYANTFGATETGCPPCSSSRIPIGEAPTQLSKEKSPFCEIRLVDAMDQEVPDGSPGELCIRGLTLFSGYYRADAANAEEFRGGWFHMGDVFVRNPNGSLDFIDRVKYLIKSGGENIYPAEIERVLMSDPRVEEVAVVRRSDPRWGEVPVAFVAARTPLPLAAGSESFEAELRALCRQELASYKQPKGVVFLPVSQFPRSASGKVQRHELEKLLPAP